MLLGALAACNFWAIWWRSAMMGIGPSGGTPRPLRMALTSSDETKSGLSASPISLWPTSRSTVTQGLPLYNSFTEKGCITYCEGTPLGCACLSLTRAPVKPSHPAAKEPASCSEKSSMAEARATSRSVVKRVAPSPRRILMALPPLTEPSGSIWATIAFAMIARLATRFGFPTSLSSATSRFLLLFGRFAGICALQFLLQ